MIKSYISILPTQLCLNRFLFEINLSGFLFEIKPLEDYNKNYTRVLFS